MDDRQSVSRRVFDAIEVVLFSTAEPVSAYQMAQMLTEEGIWEGPEGLTPGRVERLLEEMVAAWETAQRPLTVLRIAGGYQMATRPEWASLVALLLEDRRSQRLSRAALETLAIVAYRQPVIRPDIDAIRGVNSDSALKTLLERDLVSIAGRDEGPGRPLLYRTTATFLKYFGLHGLDELPDQEELTAILGAERPAPAEGHQPQLALVDGEPAVGPTEEEGAESSGAGPEEEPFLADPVEEELFASDPEGEPESSGSGLAGEDRDVGSDQDEDPFEEAGAPSEKGP